MIAFLLKMFLHEYTGMLLWPVSLPTLAGMSAVTLLVLMAAAVTVTSCINQQTIATLLVYTAFILVSGTCVHMLVAHSTIIVGRN